MAYLATRPCFITDCAQKNTSQQISITQATFNTLTMFGWDPKRNGRKSKGVGHKTKKEHRRAKENHKNGTSDPMDIVPPKMLIEDSGPPQQPLSAAPELDTHQLVAGAYIIKLDDHTGRRLDDIVLHITTLDDRVSKLEGPANQLRVDPAQNIDQSTPALKAIGALPEQHSPFAAQTNILLPATETHLPPAFSEEAQHGLSPLDQIPSYCPRCLTNHTNHIGSGVQGHDISVSPSPIVGHQQHHQTGRGGREESSFIPRHRPPESPDNRGQAFLFLFFLLLCLLAAK
ncbi:hypothetical protein QBC36DRAFT_107835 [Triangularia setosa]|uniref:Uncharacterized protein n=1 Tax=Triangularia setosa TaxID=2587417 RepID=A0AAN6WB47_9PEZI|nr:hypothetical protein QBC36DRAFT_107835 [Podospora setosa]